MLLVITGMHCKVPEPAEILSTKSEMAMTTSAESCCCEVPGSYTAVPGCDIAVPRSIWTALPFPLSTSIGVAPDVGPSGMKIDKEFGSVFIEGFLKCSRDISGGMLWFTRRRGV